MLTKAYLRTGLLRPAYGAESSSSTRNSTGWLTRASTNSNAGAFLARFLSIVLRPDPCHPSTVRLYFAPWQVPRQLCGFETALHDLTAGGAVQLAQEGGPARRFDVGDGCSWLGAGATACHRCPPPPQPINRPHCPCLRMPPHAAPSRTCSAHIAPARDPGHLSQPAAPAPFVHRSYGEAGECRRRLAPTAGEQPRAGDGEAVAAAVGQATDRNGRRRGTLLATARSGAHSIVCGTLSVSLSYAKTCA